MAQLETEVGRESQRSRDHPRLRYRIRRTGKLREGSSERAVRVKTTTGVAINPTEPRLNRLVLAEE
jgi:hypothetical protein